MQNTPTKLPHMAAIAVGLRPEYTVTVQDVGSKTVQVSYTHLESGRVVSSYFTAQAWRQALKTAIMGAEILHACEEREAAEDAALST